MSSKVSSLILNSVLSYCLMHRQGRNRVKTKHASKKFSLDGCVCAQGTLTEREGSVQLTSLLGKLIS